MKHDELRSIAHNIAASLASGNSFLVGVYDIDVFSEAAQSPEGFLTVNFLYGTTIGFQPSPSLTRTIKLYKVAVPRLCAKHGVSVAAFVEFTAQYFGSRRFTVTIADRVGRRTTTEYGGFDGQRTKMLDSEGRLRPKPIRRLS